MNCGTVGRRFVTLALIGEMFEDWVISKGLWPFGSPDLLACDYYLGINLKNKVLGRVVHSVTVYTVRQRLYAP